MEGFRNMMALRAEVEGKTTPRRRERYLDFSYYDAAMKLVGQRPLTRADHSAAAPGFTPLAGSIALISIALAILREHRRRGAEHVGDDLLAAPGRWWR